MNNLHDINSKQLDFTAVSELIFTEKKLKLSQESIEKIENCRLYLDKKLEKHGAPIYGINTGFGSLCNVKIDNDNLHKLQENLVMSHACGTGRKVDKSIVK
ncbi:MAG: aromatic amino acid lyase, partial [Lutibacter sp.]